MARNSSCFVSCFVHVRPKSSVINGKWNHIRIGPSFRFVFTISFFVCVCVCCKVPHQQRSVLGWHYYLFFAFLKEVETNQNSGGEPIICSFVQMKTMSNVLSLLDVNGSKTRSPTKIWGKATLIMAKQLKRWARSRLESCPVSPRWRTSQTVAAY